MTQFPEKSSVRKDKRGVKKRDYVAVVIGALAAIAVGQSEWLGKVDAAWIIDVSLGIGINVGIVYGVAWVIDEIRDRGLRSITLCRRPALIPYSDVRLFDRLDRSAHGLGVAVSGRKRGGVA